MNLDAHTVTTTSGQRFTAREHRELARLVYKRFGNDLGAATAAWNRLLQNDCSKEQFADLAGIEGR